MINDIQLAKYSDIEAIINTYLRDKFVGKSVIVYHYKDDTGSVYSDEYRLYYGKNKPVDESGSSVTSFSKVKYNFERTYHVCKIDDVYIKADGEYEDYGLYMFIKCEGMPEIKTDRIEEIDCIKVCNL